MCHSRISGGGISGAGVAFATRRRLTRRSGGPERCGGGSERCGGLRSRTQLPTHRVGHGYYLPSSTHCSRCLLCRRFCTGVSVGCQCHRCCSEGAVQRCLCHRDGGVGVTSAAPPIRVETWDGLGPHTAARRLEVFFLLSTKPLSLQELACCESVSVIGVIVIACINV